MSVFLNSMNSRPRRQSNINEDLKVSKNKFHPKKSLTIELETKHLRETDATLSPSPKHKEQLSINDFQLLRFLGNGRFGSVYLAKHIPTNFLFAIKQIPKSHLQSDSQSQTKKLQNQLITQLKIQLYLCHKNLIKLYTFFHDSYNIYLLLELASDGQMYQFMKDGYQFKEQSVAILVREILEGISYMHGQHVIHRDLKPENVVLVYVWVFFMQGVPKICDFGWAVYCPKEFRNTLCGTPLYLSPEILIGEGYNEKIDSWAIGTFTYQLLTGDNPFKITKKSEITRIVTQKFSMKTGSEQVQDFISRALQKQPQKRLSTKQMLEHPFIKKYRELDISEELCNRISFRLFQKEYANRRKGSKDLKEEGKEAKDGNSVWVGYEK